MPHKTDGQLQEQTRTWLGTISSDLRQAVQHEIEGLRASMDQRIAALEAAVLRADTHFEQLAQNLHDLVTQETEAAANDARRRAEAAALSEITAVQAHLQAEFETTRTAFDVTRAALESKLADAERDLAAIRQSRDEQAVSLDHARQQVHALEEANAQMARLRQVADLRLKEEIQRRTMVAKQLDAARQEIRLAQAEGDSCRLEAHLAGERAQALEERLRGLEEEAVEIPTLSEEDAAEPLVLNQLRKGLHDLGRAKGEELLLVLADCLGESFPAAAVFTVEGKRLKLKASRVSESMAAVQVTETLSLEGDHLLAQAFRQRSSATVDASSDGGAVGLWKTPLGHAMALCVLAHGRVVALAYVESPRGQSNGRVQMLETAAEIFVGSVNQRLNQNQRGIEGSRPEPPLNANTPPATADPVKTPAPVSRVDSLSTSVGQANAPSTAVGKVNAPSTAVDQDAVSRQAAPRVKLDQPVEVQVEGVASTLVNISASGAQFLSPLRLALNRSVRIVLVGKTSGLRCDARIVWARLESGRSGIPAYRAGVRFTSTDPQAVMTFISQHRSTPQVIS
jgi:hypothetical protein